MSAAAAVSPREDAQENRARILAAAHAALLGRGEVKLNAIAEAAEVGQGTLYRHFYTREALLVEVYGQEVEELVAAAPALLDEHGPAEALGRWLTRVAACSRVKRGLYDAVRAAASQDAVATHAADIAGAVELLLAAGVRAGELRDDVDAADVILLLGFLTRVPEDAWDRRTQRGLDVLRA